MVVFSPGWLGTKGLLSYCWTSSYPPESSVPALRTAVFLCCLLCIRDQGYTVGTTWRQGVNGKPRGVTLLPPQIICDLLSVQAHARSSWGGSMWCLAAETPHSHPEALSQETLVHLCSALTPPLLPNPCPLYHSIPHKPLLFLIPPQWLSLQWARKGKQLLLALHTSLGRKQDHSDLSYPGLPFPLFPGLLPTSRVLGLNFTGLFVDGKNP